MVSARNAWDHDPFLVRTHKKIKQANHYYILTDEAVLSSNYNGGIVLKIGMIWQTSNLTNGKLSAHGPIIPILQRVD